jgi:hypothetical protein
MEIRTSDTTEHTRRPMPPGLALTATAAVALLTACSPAPDAPLSVTDWCWLHYGLAPAGALDTDAGPASHIDADDWIVWLGATADAPPDRRSAHRRQQQLVDQFASDGTWDDADRAAYRAAAHADPTPATVCETVGARIVANGDGTLPSHWQRRFLDPGDPAHSELAAHREQRR